MTCLCLGLLIARALVPTIAKLAIKLFYCNALKTYIFAAQKDAKAFESVQRFLLKGLVKVSGESRTGGFDNTASIASTRAKCRFRWDVTAQ